MRRVIKVALAMLAVPVAVLASFAPNIHGDHRFTHVCEIEGDLRIHHKLKKGVPWQAAEHFGSYSVASLRTVPFVRVGRNGELLDMRYRDEPLGDRRSYDEVPADSWVTRGYDHQRHAPRRAPAEPLWL